MCSEVYIEDLNCLASHNSSLKPYFAKQWDHLTIYTCTHAHTVSHNMHVHTDKHKHIHIYTPTHHTHACMHARTHTHTRMHAHTHEGIHTASRPHTDGGSLPVELVGCGLDGTGPMREQGLLGVSETMQCMRGCIISHSYKMDAYTMYGATYIYIYTCHFHTTAM